MSDFLRIGAKLEKKEDSGITFIADFLLASMSILRLQGCRTYFDSLSVEDAGKAYTLSGKFSDLPQFAD